jgi:3-carboxy-cis,cis-muconate cycloisomerase
MTCDVFTHPWLAGLFGDPPAAAIWSPDRQIAHMLRVEAAYTRALGHAGTVPQEQATRAACRIAAFETDIDALRRGTARDGLPVPDLVRQIKDAVGADAGSVHVGMTSQDVLDTALTLTLQEINTLYAQRLTALTTALERLIDQYGAVQIMGRTRMQAALPIAFAQRASGWSAPITAHAARLASLRPSVECLQLGGPVGDRATLGPQADAIASDMAARLGLSNPPAAWHTQREGLADYAGFLSRITGTLGKMGQDICLMAQQGINEIQISGGGGSSAMPHKQNPVLAELLITLARFNATQVSAMHHALVHEQDRSGAAWALEWMILPPMTMATARALAAAQDMCARITITSGRA